MDYSELSPELLEKAKSCESAEELISLATEAGIDLSDEQLDAIAGGGEWDCKKFGKVLCPDLLPQ